MKITLENIHRDANSSFRLLVNPNLSDLFYWHFHPEYELTYIIEGKGIRYIGNSIQNFKEGDIVEVIEGNLKGTKGQLVEIEGKNRVLITLEHIQHTFRISIEKQLLKKIM